MTHVAGPDRGLVPDLDPVLTLAQTMHATPSAYAVLLGAGVSIAAGVPSAWGVVESLVRSLAAQEQDDAGTDPAGWFRGRYGHDPSYGELLEKLARTQLERQRLLAQFFDPRRDEDGQSARVEPSPAHRSLARLVASGHVRVILTLNFDRLAETALRDVGIEPNVVASPADLAGLAPLHTLRAVVVHLHGDYRSATTMLNTTTELGAYPDPVDRFLDRVFTDYGLFILGWSATYDEALRAAVARQTARHFTPYWVDPFPLQSPAEHLRANRAAVKITATADDALGRLADAVTALDARAARHPLTLPVAVATAKRGLNGRATAVELHDQLHTEFERLRQTPDQTRTHFHLDAGDSLSAVYARVDEAVLVPCALVATAAYWGTPNTDRWWLSEIVRYAQPPIGAGGMTALIEAQTAPAAHLLYAAGVAATAAHRWDLLLQLLTDLHTTINGRRQPIAERTADPGKVYLALSEETPSTRMHHLHAPTFVDHLALGWDAYNDAWETFELLRLVQIAYLRPPSAVVLNEIREARQTQADRDEDVRQAESVGADVNGPHQAQAAAWQEAAKALGRYAGIVHPDRPHVRVADDDDQNSWTNHQHPPVVGRRLLADLLREGDQHPLVQAGFCGGDHTHMQITLEATNLAIGMVGRESAFRQSASLRGWVPDYFWLDTGERPSR